MFWSNLLPPFTGSSLKVKAAGASEIFMHIYQANTVKPALNGNIFRSYDFGAEKDVEYPGLNRNMLRKGKVSSTLMEAAGSSEMLVYHRT
jgi:hypothetical protein